jgi:hypothetical protein
MVVAMLRTAREPAERNHMTRTNTSGPTFDGADIARWTDALDMSEDRMLKAAAGREVLLAHATGARMVTAWTLSPAPIDPALHVEQAHVDARRHLARLTEHDPTREVASVMTEELFDRLTVDPPAPLSGVTRARRYTYTPRKALRRVLDHALDHLNQIDQWLEWRRRGVVPTPTDGWVPSTVTLPDDRLALGPADLDAWLWRIDQAVRMLVHRARGLTPEELDWAPPDGGWPLRRVLHHVARSERLYAASLDEALSADDPETRYAGASHRLGTAVGALHGLGADASVAYAGLYGVLRRPDEVIHDLLVMEHELRSGAD